LSIANISETEAYIVSENLSLAEVLTFKNGKGVRQMKIINKIKSHFYWIYDPHKNEKLLMLEGKNADYQLLAIKYTPTERSISND
jgi:hypothetical protein